MQTALVEILLETERLALRQFVPSDLDALVELYNDADVMHFINNGQPVPREEVRGDLDHFLGWHRRSDDRGFWAAIERSSERFVGWFHFRPHEVDQPRVVEVGYRLHRSAWGRGLASEGTKALIDHGFATSDIDRVTAETMAVHTASRRVMEHAGMRLVRTFQSDWPVRIPGDEHGDVEYAIDRADWQGAAPTP